jgi:hypothetical protein
MGEKHCWLTENKRLKTQANRLWICGCASSYSYLGLPGCAFYTIVTKRRIIDWISYQVWCQQKAWLEVNKGSA